MEDERGSLLLPKNMEEHHPAHDRGTTELRNFRSYLRWVYVDHSNVCKAGLSWTVFFTLAFVVPTLSHFLLDCPTCDRDHSRPYHIPVQISLSVFAALSFISISSWDRRYGFRKFLFLDKLGDESLKIQRGYSEQMQVCELFSFLLFLFPVLFGMSSIICHSIFLLSVGKSNIVLLFNTFGTTQCSFVCSN